MIIFNNYAHALVINASEIKTNKQNVINELAYKLNDPEIQKKMKHYGYVAVVKEGEILNEDSIAANVCPIHSHCTVDFENKVSTYENQNDAAEAIVNMLWK